MEEQLISFETAKLAKEKGFDTPTRNFYADESWKDEQVYTCNEVGYPEYTKDMGNNHGFGDITLTPTQSLLNKWLREVHKIHIEIEYSFKQNKYSVDIYNSDEKIIDNQLFKISSKIEDYLKYKSYEDALEFGLQEGLKLIK